MDKKGIAEIKKIFSKKNIRLSKLMTVYADAENNVLSTNVSQFLTIGEDEQFKYADIFKKVLSRKFGRNLYNLEFPLEEEKEGGKQASLYSMLSSSLAPKDGERLVRKILENYPSPDRHMVLLAFGSYDIPVKGEDNQKQDESDDVYNFIIGAVCPVVLVKEGLVFDEASGQFINRSTDWAVQAPECGFLYPAFDDRASNIHGMLYYTKKADERHEDMVSAVFGCTLGASDEDGKKSLTSLITDTLGNNCTFENVKDITAKIAARAEDSGSTVMTKAELQSALKDAGAGEKALEEFNERFDAAFSDGMNAEEVSESKAKISSDYLDLTIPSGSLDYLERRCIDGREYVLVPVSDNISLNGVPLVQDKS